MEQCSFYNHIQTIVRLSGSSDLPNSDHVIGVTREQGATVGAPGEGDASWVDDSVDSGGTSEELGVVLVEVGDDGLGDQIPDLDSLLGGSAQPVSVGGEGKSVDDVSGIERVQVLALVEVPELGSSVLTTRSAERTVRGDSDGVDVVAVSREVGAELAVGQVPDLDLLVPATRNNQRIGGVGGETNTADPFGVTLVFDGVLALTEGVPETDGLVARSRDDLSVVSGEGNAQNVLAVSDESLGGGSRVEVPETESVIP